jgi:hypothetical protein
MFTSTHRLLLPMLAVSVLLLAACGSKSSTSASSTTVPISTVPATVARSTSAAAGAPATAAATRQPAAAGRPLSDCDYASQFAKAFAGLGNAEAAASPANRNAIAPLVSSATQALRNLQSITPPPAFAQFHTDFKAAFQDVVTQLQRAQTSLDAGDAASAQTAAATAQDTFSKQVDTLQQKYASLTARLDACPTPTP